MKLYFNIYNHQERDFFSMLKSMPGFLKRKAKVLEILMTSWRGNRNIRAPYVCVDDELRRVLIVGKEEKKIISFGFEYNIILAQKDVNDSENYVADIKYKCGNVTLSMLSGIQSIISYLERGSMYDPYWEQSLIDDPEEENIDVAAMRLFDYMRSCEAGYLRYDDDPEREQALIHPRYHIDVNYTPTISYKLGLARGVGIGDMAQLLAEDKKCAYVQIEHNMFDE